MTGDLSSSLASPAHDLVAIVDDEPEVAAGDGLADRLERNELVAEVNESHVPGLDREASRRPRAAGRT